MSQSIYAWAQRHGVSAIALRDLFDNVYNHWDELQREPLAMDVSKAESRVQADIRMGASQHDAILFRNNVGALQDERGVPVRYGLANDSKKHNEKVKSADLIGVQRVQITPAMVGLTFGRFVSIECKAPGWSFSGTDREVAQQRWAELMRSYGALASFSTGGFPI